jgi:trk system potassium uptake protein TrkH
VHSRLVLVYTLAITLGGSILIFVTENWGNDFSLRQKIVSSLFQCSTASTTTGFNSIDIGTMHAGNLFLLIVIMFIGAGSGSTGGGIKMTTMAVTILSVLAIVRNRTTVNVFQRRLSFEVIRNSFAIFVLSAAWTAAASYVLLITEKKEFISLLFETTSALATVGLSTGITAGLSGMGKMIIIISMFIGRIGPLGIGILLLQRKNVEPDYKYSTTDLFIG